MEAEPDLAEAISFMLGGAVKNKVIGAVVCLCLLMHVSIGD